jgi:hypothetical protein
MHVRKPFLVAFAALLLVGACGGEDDNGSASPNDAIGIEDAPAAGPPVPGATTTTASAAAPGRQTPAPWSAPTRNVSALIRRAGLPALPQEMLQYHIHSHLDVFVNGASQTVPPDLGIDRAAGVLSPLHTHDDTGIIHVENDKETDFTLGQLFIEWDVRLDSACVGSYCRAATPVKYYVDGEEYTGDPTKIVFERHREIAIVVGTPPRDIPEEYDFPEGV